MTYNYPILNTIAYQLKTPFLCEFIDIKRDITKQKNNLASSIIELMKRNKGSELEASMKQPIKSNINCVIFKIPKNYIIVDTDDEISQNKFISTIESINDDIKSKIGKTPSISRALGINMKKHFHYYFMTKDDFKMEGQKIQNKGGEYGNLDILGEGGDYAGFIIEHIESEISADIIPLMDKELFEKIAPVKQKKKTIQKTDSDRSADETDDMHTCAPLEQKFRNIAVWRKYCELLPNSIERTWTEWRSLAMFFKQHFEEDGYELFQIWSKKWYRYNETDDIEMWDKIRNCNITVRTPIKFMKEWATKSLPIWLQFVEDKSTFTMQGVALENGEKSYFISIKTIQGGILDIAEVMAETIKEKAIYCKDEWYIFNDTQKLWKNGKVGPTTIITRTIKKYFEWNIMKISEKLQDADDKEGEDFRKYLIDTRRRLDTPTSCNHFATHLKDLNLDDDFKKKLNVMAGKIAYQNGIYDIKTDTFREGIFYEDSLTFTAEFNYKKADPVDKAKVKDILMKINSMEEWKYEYYIKMLGYALSGYATKEQVAFFCIGLTAGNGKSTVFEALSKRLDCYVKKLQSNAFSVSNTKKHKQFADIGNRRILWVNEVERGDQDIEAIKNMSDGYGFKNEVMHGTEAEIAMDAKLFFVSNGEPKFASDEGIKRRYRYVQFQSKFFDNDADFDAYPNKDPKRHFKSDSDIPSYLSSDEGMNALLEILYDGARLYFKDGLKTPAVYDDLKKEAIKNNDIYDEFIVGHFKEVDGKCIHKSELAGMWDEAECIGKFRLDDCMEKMKAKGFIFDTKKQKKIAGKVKTGCFMNVQFFDGSDDVEQAD